MSTFKVPVTKILAVNPHPNADRLELATVYGFQVVVQKGKYSPGDVVIYIPIDSVLPPNVEAALFGPDSKIKLNKSRVKQIRIRQFPSQGMIASPDSLLNGEDKLTLEDDLSVTLGITKYEPPEPDYGPRVQQKRDRPLENPRFHKYGGLENIKWYPNLFKEGEQVQVTEKLHGTNCRATKQPTVKNTLLKKIKGLLGLLPKYEYCYGSNNVQLQHRSGRAGFYGDDVYAKALKRAGAEDRLKNGETIYGEVIGPGIQKGYDYGLTEHRFVLFDVKVTREDGSQEFLSPLEAEEYALDRGFEYVPVLYTGPFSVDKVEELSVGCSMYHPIEKVREGCVVKSVENYSTGGTKKALKVINPAYLDKDQSDFH